MSAASAPAAPMAAAARPAPPRIDDFALARFQDAVSAVVADAGMPDLSMRQAAVLMELHTGGRLEDRGVGQIARRRPAVVRGRAIGDDLLNVVGRVGQCSTIPTFTSLGVTGHLYWVTT